MNKAPKTLMGCITEMRLIVYIVGVQKLLKMIHTVFFGYPYASMVDLYVALH